MKPDVSSPRYRIKSNKSIIVKCRRRKIDKIKGLFGPLTSSFKVRLKAIVFRMGLNYFAHEQILSKISIFFNLVLQCVDVNIY